MARTPSRTATQWRKYLDMLGNTLFHKGGPKNYRTFLATIPSRVRESGEFGPIVRLLPRRDQLNSDMNVIEMYLLRTFANAMSDTFDPLYREQTLIAALQMKDIRSVLAARFFQYAALHNRGACRATTKRPPTSTVTWNTKWTSAGCLSTKR